MDAKSLEVCVLGAANAGKSSFMNCMIGKNVSAVSNKYCTTDDLVTGIYTDMDIKT